jgi:hypothetical protein
VGPIGLADEVIGLVDERDGIHRAIFLVVGVTASDPAGFDGREKVFPGDPP